MPFMGIPTFLKAKILQAKKGGDRSYREVGYHFATHLDELIEEETEEQEQAAVEGFWEDLGSTSAREAKMRQWLKRHTPGIAEAIPSRRMPTFLAGIDAAWEDDRIPV
jgi:hypothetical protein